MAVHAPKRPDDTLPSKEAVRRAQQRALAHDGIRVSERQSFDAPVGTVVLHSDDLFRESVGGSRVL